MPTAPDEKALSWDKCSTHVLQRRDMSLKRKRQLSVQRGGSNSSGLASQRTAAKDAGRTEEAAPCLTPRESTVPTAEGRGEQIEARLTELLGTPSQRFSTQRLSMPSAARQVTTAVRIYELPRRRYTPSGRACSRSRASLTCSHRLGRPPAVLHLASCRAGRRALPAPK
jgi:hypothetical protein